MSLQRWCEQTVPDRLGKKCIRERYGTGLPWGNELGYDAISIGDQDRLASLGKTDVLAQLVLQDFQAYSSHAAQGSFQRLPCQR